MSFTLTYWKFCRKSRISNGSWFIREVEYCWL